MDTLRWVPSGSDVSQPVLLGPTADDITALEMSPDGRHGFVTTATPTYPSTKRYFGIAMTTGGATEFTGIPADQEILPLLIH